MQIQQETFPLQQILEHNQISSELKEYLFKFYQSLNLSKELQLQQIITIPIKELINQSNQNDLLQKLLTPIYHIILGYLTQNQQEGTLQNIINESIDENEDDEILSYFNRYDLSNKTIPMIPKQSFESNEQLQLILKNLDNTIPIELDSDEDDIIFSLLQKKHIAMIFGRNYLFYNQNEENAMKEINLEVTKDGAPLMENVQYSKDFIESIRFYNSVTSGVSQTQFDSFSFDEEIDLDSSSIGMFLGNCIKGYCSELKLQDIDHIMNTKNERLQASLILGLMITYKHSNNKNIIEILKLICDPSLHDCPSLIIQSLSLLAIGLISSNKESNQESCILEQLMISHLCSPLSNNVIGFHHIWSACVGLGCLRFGKQLTNDEFEIMSKVINGCSYDSLKSYSEKINYSDIKENGNIQKNTKGSVYRNNMISSFVGIPSASLCLGLSYFNTFDFSALELVKIQNDLKIIGNTQPDHLLIKVIAQSLIQFDHIKPTNEWIYSNVPECLREHRFASFDFINAKFALVSGACYALGLKYIGTLHEELKQLLMKFALKLKSSIDNLSKNANKKQNERALKNIPYFERYLKIILLSLCMIMCGSKDSEIMELLDWINLIHFNNQTFGSHQIVSVCFGLLNTGMGEYSINPTIENIPIYILSFYPLFEENFDDPLIYPSYLHHLGLSCLKRRMLYGYNHSINQYEEMVIDIVLNEKGRQLYNQQIKTITIPSIIPPPQYIDYIIPHGEVYLAQQMIVDEELNNNIIRVVYAPLIDHYGILPELLQYNQQLKNTNDVYIHQMNQTIENTLQWMRTVIVSKNYSENDLQLIKMILQMLSESNDMKMKIKCEALTLMLM